LNKKIIQLITYRDAYCNLNEYNFTKSCNFLNDDYTPSIQFQTDVEFWTYKIKSYLECVCLQLTKLRNTCMPHFSLHVWLHCSRSQGAFSNVNYL